MKIQIKEFKWVREEISDREFEIPETPLYFFETGIRRAIKITPIRTTWNKKYYKKPEEIWEFEIICVYLSLECKIEKFNIRLGDLEDLTVISNKKEKQFVEAWINNSFNKRTEERFNEDLLTALKQIAPNLLKRKKKNVETSKIKSA